MYFEKEELRQAKQMSAIEFLKRYRPEELVRCGTGEYELRSHDSFKDQRAPACGTGKAGTSAGKSALDYLGPCGGRSLYRRGAVPAGAGAARIYADAQKRRAETICPSSGGAGKNTGVELYLQSRGVQPGCDPLLHNQRDTCTKACRITAVCSWASTRMASRAMPRCVPTCDGPNAFKEEQVGSDKRYSFCIPQR